MTMDLQRGYATTETLRSQGIRAGRLYQGGQTTGGGDPHAVIRGQRKSLCGRTMIYLADGPPGSFEKLCPECEKILQESEPYDWTQG